MSKRYFIGDAHFGHKLVTATRGFFKEENGETVLDVAGHDAAIIKSITDYVPAGSELVFMGDQSIDKDWEHGLEMLEPLKLLGYRLVLRPGNHDWAHPMHYTKVSRVLPKFYEVYDEIMERSVEKQWSRTLYLNHFPIIGDRGSRERHKTWRFPVEVLDQENAWSIHAHTHQDLITDPSRPKHICTSWDVKRRPISEDEIKRVVLGQAGKRELSVKASWGSLEVYRELAEKAKRNELKL